MTTSGSSLYSGSVRHTRITPIDHDFEYRVYYTFLDVDELAGLDRDLRLFSIGHFNLFSFHPEDHGVDDISLIRPWVEDLLAPAGVSLEGGPIRLLSLPRVLGYVFNPLSVWYCYGPDETLRAVIHEVRNTFGDRHLYVVPIRDAADLRHGFDKRMHVSPFNDMEQRYEFTLTEPGPRLAVAIAQDEGDGTILRAGLRLSRIPMSDRNLLRLFVTRPLVTLRVIVGIHWQALRLWLKGARYRPRPMPPSFEVTIVNERVSP